jgi:hypothetical protein
MLARLGRVLYWCGLAVASLCGIAAFTILVAIITNKISAWDAWAAVFFAIVGGIARGWLVAQQNHSCWNLIARRFDNSPPWGKLCAFSLAIDLRLRLDAGWVFGGCLRKFIVLAFALVIVGCATITKGTTQTSRDRYAWSARRDVHHSNSDWAEGCDDAWQRYS